LSQPTDEVGPRHLRRNARRSLILGASAVVVLVVVIIATSGGGSSPSTSPGTRTTTTTTKSPTSPPPPPNPAHSRTFLSSDGLESSWVIAENKLPGTTGWQIHHQPKTGSIAGFASVPYAAQRNHVALYVDTTAPRFHVMAYRMGYYGGAGGRLVWRSPELAGREQPACPLTPVVNMVSCDNWKPSLTFTVTSAFLPGDYLLRLVGSGNEQSYVLLTIWDPTSHAAYVIKNDIYTQEAWNTYGGYDFYQGIGSCPPGVYPTCNRARVVSLDRPFAGNGAADFFSNEYPLVRFAEEEGLDVTYADDLTLEQHPKFLLQHRVLLSLGHDECWSLGERLAAESAMKHGVNMVFFGASAVLRHVRLQSSPLGPDREVVDYRDSSEDPLNGKGNPLLVTGNTWFSPPADWPESGFTGEMYAGFLEPGTPSAPFVVNDAKSWIFKGTGLQDGSQLPGVIEADFDHVAPSWPMPANLEVLGHSPILLADSQTDLGTWGRYTYSDMTYYTSPTSKAGVLDTGDNNWIYAMTPCGTKSPNCSAPEVQKITGNLFRLFGQGPAGRLIPSVANWQQVVPAGS
jgi:hypothetical protein